MNRNANKKPERHRFNGRIRYFNRKWDFILQTFKRIRYSGHFF